MSVSEVNRARYRATMISREVKWLFQAIPERFRQRIRARLWRWLFLSPEGEVHRAGEIVLADLREFAAGQPLFSPDPLTMARRAGRREVLERIVNYLNLDEQTVRKLMELDDGLE